jgi:hypothetical protein
VTEICSAKLLAPKEKDFNYNAEKYLISKYHLIGGEIPVKEQMYFEIEDAPNRLNDYMAEMLKESDETLKSELERKKKELKEQRSGDYDLLNSICAPEEGEKELTIEQILEIINFYYHNTRSMAQIYLSTADGLMYNMKMKKRLVANYLYKNNIPFKKVLSYPEELKLMILEYRTIKRQCRRMTKFFVEDLNSIKFNILSNIGLLHIKYFNGRNSNWEKFYHDNFYELNQYFNVDLEVIILTMLGNVGFKSRIEE